MNPDDPHQQVHQLSFTDGPLEGHVYLLRGVVPFAQLQIDGQADNPIFHLYRMDEGASFEKGQVDSGQCPVPYKFVRTISKLDVTALLWPRRGQSRLR